MNPTGALRKEILLAGDTNRCWALPNRSITGFRAQKVKTGQDTRSLRQLAFFFHLKARQCTANQATRQYPIGLCTWGFIQISNWGKQPMLTSGMNFLRNLTGGSSQL